MTRSPLTAAKSQRESEVVQRPTQGEKRRGRRKKSGKRSKRRKRNDNNWSITDEVKQEKQQGTKKKAGNSIQSTEELS